MKTVFLDDIIIKNTKEVLYEGKTVFYVGGALRYVELQLESLTTVVIE